MAGLSGAGGAPAPLRGPVLLHAPHRVFFLLGAVQVLGAMAWWAAHLGASLPGGAWPGAWTHGVWMVFGVYPPFIFGFLMTAMPRWMGAAPLAQGAYLAPAGLLAAGWCAYAAALAWPALLPGACVLIAAGWALVTATLARVARTPGDDRRHALLLVAALGVGLVALVLVAAAAIAGTPHWLPAALALGFWGCLLAVFVIVSHRMIPFFSSVVIRDYVMRRPFGVLFGLLAAFLAHAALELGSAQRWLWLADAPAALAAAWLSWAWQPARSRSIKLLAMLHIGFAWLALGLALSAAQSLAALAGVSLLGRAPLHALGVGFFGAMLLAMASRVSLGHAGRDLAADRATWRVFLGVQAVAVVRVLAEVLRDPGPVWTLAALLWLAVFGAWAWRYAPLYWRPRTDGRPG